MTFHRLSPRQAYGRLPGGFGGTLLGEDSVHRPPVAADSVPHLPVAEDSAHPHQAVADSVAVDIQFLYDE